MSDRAVIVIDGSSAMSDEVQREFRFRLLPIHVLFGDEDFTPGVNMTTAEYYEKLASSKKPPTTAAPSLGECVEIYQSLVKEGFRSILVITVINEASVTHTPSRRPRRSRWAERRSRSSTRGPPLAGSPSSQPPARGCCATAAASTKRSRS